MSGLLVRVRVCDSRVGLGCCFLLFVLVSCCVRVLVSSLLNLFGGLLWGLLLLVGVWCGLLVRRGVVGVVVGMDEEPCDGEGEGEGEGVGEEGGEMWGFVSFGCGDVFCGVEAEEGGEEKRLSEAFGDSVLSSHAMSVEELSLEKEEARKSRLVASLKVSGLELVK